jgi:uncharacterized alpha-E superfamily protein
MLSAFAGLLAENPTRGHGWRFLAIGRRMERAIQMLDLIRVGVATAPFPDDPYLEVLLQVADSSTTYRSRYLTSIRTKYVLELLLQDEANPRSVAFQVASMAERLSGLPRPDGLVTDTLPAEQGLAGDLVRLVHERSVDDLKRRDVHGKRPALEVHLRTIVDGVTNVSRALAARYLSHSVLSQLRPV